MVAREDVHRLVDQLTDTELKEAERYLTYLQSGASDFFTWALENAPEDDEPTTPEEDRLAEEAWQEYQRGEAISAEEARRILLG